MYDTFHSNYVEVSSFYMKVGNLFSELNFNTFLLFLRVMKLGCVSCCFGLDVVHSVSGFSVGLVYGVGVRVGGGIVRLSSSSKIDLIAHARTSDSGGEGRGDSRGGVGSISLGGISEWGRGFGVWVVGL